MQNAIQTFVPQNRCTRLIYENRCTKNVLRKSSARVVASYLYKNIFHFVWVNISTGRPLSSFSKLLISKRPLNFSERWLGSLNVTFKTGPLFLHHIVVKLSSHSNHSSGTQTAAIELPHQRACPNIHSQHNLAA